MSEADLYRPSQLNDDLSEAAKDCLRDHLTGQAVKAAWEEYGRILPRYHGEDVVRIGKEEPCSLSEALAIWADEEGWQKGVAHGEA